MYPGLSGSAENHKRGYCSDGVKQLMKADTVPDWPQPPGIFELGTKFNPIKFLATIRDVYEWVMNQNGHDNDLTMEYEAFGKLLHSRTIVSPDGQSLFKLFALEIPLSTPSELIVDYNDAQYLRIDCLRDPTI
jgi:hypothetical protein